MPKKPVRPLGMVRSNAPVPFLNPFTERLTRENENRKLVAALQCAKPVIDNSSPLQCPHLQDNKKREWLTDMKYAKIERENALLLERLCLIARPRSQFIKPKTFTPGIALDYHLRPIIDNVESDLHVPGRSLNGVARKHEQERIVIDNKHILQRICNSKGAYSARRWQQEGQQQRKYAEIRRRVMPEGSRPGTGQSAHRLNSKSSPEMIYRTSGRPATAAAGTRSGYSPRSALAESFMSTAHAAGRPMTAA
ncbi:hypothetical protein ABBQ32_000368 [Trebouxia sp. C0010 RCD-2024]